MSVEIREVQGEELLDTAFKIGDYAFMPTPSEEELPDYYLEYVQERLYLVLFEDGKPMATGCTVPMTQNVRGHIYNMGGVAGVATHPAGRRKGYARQILQALLDHMRDDEQPFSTLYPFRESFYGRLGYVNFPLRRFYRINPGNLTPLLRQDIPGEVTVQEIKEGFEDFRKFILSMQPLIHGMGVMPPLADEMKAKRNRLHVALAHHEGETVGVLAYRIPGYREDTPAPYFFYRNTIGKYLLLQWIARHADHTGPFILRTKPDDQVATWLYDMDAAPQDDMKHGGTRIHPQGRVTVVSQTGGMQIGEGEFTARIYDEHCAWNNGVYRFASVNGRLEVTPVDATPECELQIQGLSALVYGGYDPADFAFRGWGAPSMELQLRMQQMFPLALPYLHEDF